MNKNEWKNNSGCQDFDTNLFFEKYEEEPELRPQIDDICSDCPVLRQCFAVGISQKEWGVWGGIYLESGKISREFNRHRTKEDWAKTWQNLTMGK
jgi:hypothetical protein